MNRKYLGVFLLTAILILGLGAIAYAQDQIVLKYMTWASGEAATWIREDFIEPFEAKNPHIKIEYEAVPFGEFWRKLMTMYAAGNPPDLMHMSVGYIYDYADRGLLLNLQPYFERDLDPELYYAEPMKAVRYPSMETGDLYAMPFAFVMTSLYYNKDMFDEAGLAYPTNDWTWDDVLVAAKALTKDVDGDGNIDQWGFFFEPTYEVIDPMIYAWGGRVLSDDLSTAKLDSDEAEAAVQFLVDMMWKHEVAPTPQIYTGLGNLFETGRAAMTISGIWNLDLYRKIEGFSWDVVVHPAGPARRVVRMWPDSFGISATTKYPDEAWEYVKHVINYGKVDRYSGQRKVPIYKPLAESDEWLERDKSPDKAAYIASMEFGHPLDFRPNWGEWSAAREAELERAFLGEIPVREALRNANEAVQGVLDDF